MYTILYNASEIVQVCNRHEPYKIGSDMRDLSILKDSAVVLKDSLIHDIGPTSDILSRYPDSSISLKIDLTGKCLIPGLVDGHTHPVFSGDRVHEFAMKIDGRSYMEIHAAGGGIMFTVNHVKASTEEELYTSLITRLDKFLKAGTTLVECKTGYGIDLEGEVKMLKVLKRAQDSHKITMVCTYLPAHAVPPGSTEAEMAADICENQIPRIQELKLQGLVNPELIDVFCEKNIYELETTERILRAGKAIGLEGNFHGEELFCLDSAVMGGRVGVRAISHLEYISDSDISAMAQYKISAVMLPSTQYILHLPVPPVRKIIDAGVIVALGSDFNPNAWCYDMKLIMNLACINYRMNMAEALVAATINAANSVGKSEMYGSIEVGKKADLVVIGTERWEHVIYAMADSPISMVFKHGEIVYSV